jgi:hypothetical protein
MATSTQIVALLDSINFPAPFKVEPLSGTGAYHAIWALIYSPTTMANLVPEQSPNMVTGSLILRIANCAIPHIKTMNEVATLRYLSSHSSIPVPSVLYYDTSASNVIHSEYMVMTRLRGTIASELYFSICSAPEKMDRVLEQMAKFHIELFQHSFHHLGGLKIDENGVVVIGPPLDEHYYQLPQIASSWPAGETYSSLNPCSEDGYATFVGWISTHVEKYINGLSISPTATKFATHIPRLEAFLKYIQEKHVAKKLNNVDFRLAHNDLHFAQFLLDPESCNITGILDWEFASIVPFPLWRRSFLMYIEYEWNACVSEREKLYTRFEELARSIEGGEEMLQAAKWKCREQELVWEVCNKLRGILQVCVYNNGRGREEEWMTEVLEKLDHLGVPL